MGEKMSFDERLKELVASQPSAERKYGFPGSH